MQSVLQLMLKPQEVKATLKSVFLGTKPKWTVVCDQSSNYAKAYEGAYSAGISLLWYET